MSIDKKALFNLSSEPYLKPISNLGVGFYNLDENTAVLQFQLSNSKGPLLISENNLTAYAYFESANGSASDVIELNIIDGIKGLVEITLDTAFLQASTSTTVKGQVYIAVNNHDGDPAYNEVAVFREFTFEVADALINKISSFTKVENIKMFNQLKMHIEQRVNDIDIAIANGEDYVAQMNATLLNGRTELNQIVADGTATIDGSVTQTKTDVTAIAESAKADITTLSNNTKTSVQNTADNAITDITNTSNTATTHVDTKVTEFNQTLEANGFVTPEQLTTDLDALTWQKHKLTDDSGIIPSIALDGDETTLHNLPTGFHYCTSVPIVGMGSTSQAGFVEVFENTYVTHIIFRPYNSNQQFIKRFYDTWGEWEEVGNNQSDTGWIGFQLLNGAISNTEFNGDTSKGFDCSYRIVKNGSVTTKTIRLNGRQLTQGQIVAQLPNNLFEYAHSFPVRVPTSTSYFGGYVTMRPTGEVRFYINGDSSNWNTSTGYLYGEYSWVE